MTRDPTTSDPATRDSTSRPGGEFRLRDIAVSAYAPSLVSSIGHGAVTPVLALHARALGADVATAAFIVSLMPLGMLLTSLPAGAIVARVGERRALFVAGLVDAVAMAWAARAGSVVQLGLAVALGGAAWTVFLLSRQGYLIAAVPLRMRARSMSMLGGTFRIGMLVGPLAGAALVRSWGIPAAFTLAAAMSLLAGLLGLTMTDFEAEQRKLTGATGHAKVWTVLREHRRVFATIGVAVIIIGVSRSVRGSLLPLWAEHIGLDAAQTSLVFAVAAVIDIALFLPGGWVMDTYGRTPVAVPVVVAVGIGCLLLPLTSTFAGITAVMVLIAAGNGLGSGIVMTLGADCSPDVGRAQFLGGWRLCGDIGNSGGPLLVSAIAAAAPLAVACVAAGVLALAGSAWVGYWVRGIDRSLRVAGRAGPGRH